MSSPYRTYSPSVQVRAPRTPRLRLWWHWYTRDLALRIRARQARHWLRKNIGVTRPEFIREEAIRIAQSGNLQRLAAQAVVNALNGRKYGLVDLIVRGKD